MHNFQQGRTHQILLMERDSSVLGIMNDVLVEEEYEVLKSECPLDPADVSNLKPDLIVLDMPSGATSPELDFVHQLKSDSHTAHIPILALCRAFPSKDVPAWTQQNGIAGLIRKPFDLDEFLGAVESAIESVNVASLAARHETSVQQATQDTQPRT